MAAGEMRCHWRRLGLVIPLSITAIVLHGLDYNRGHSLTEYRSLEYRVSPKSPLLSLSPSPPSPPPPLPQPPSLFPRGGASDSKEGATARPDTTEILQTSRLPRDLLVAPSPGDYHNDTMVYTYVDLSNPIRELSKNENMVDLLTMWADSWRAHGWTPRILTQKYAEGHSGYKAFVDVAEKNAFAVSAARGHREGKKDVNKSVAFRVRGLMQFFAKAAAGAGILTDSDVINYGLTPQDVRDAAIAAAADPLNVAIHDGRKCTPAKKIGRRVLPQGYKCPANLMPEIYCSAVNNGMTSGSGAAYHKLVKGMLEKQDLSMAKKDLALFTEMRILNMLGKRHVDRVLLGISFTGAFDGAWRRVKVLHWWGSGIVNWQAALCGHLDDNAPEKFIGWSIRWKNMGMCKKDTMGRLSTLQRTAVVRAVRDPALRFGAEEQCPCPSQGA